MSREKNGGSYTQAQWDWVADRYREGYTLAELSRFLYLRHSTITYHLKERGVYPRTHTPLEERDFPSS